jgi:hypothetical protein
VAAPQKGDPEAENDDWRSVFMGLAFSGDRDVWASEGNSGRVRLVHMPGGEVEQIYSLNQDGFQDSYTGDLVLDRAREVLYVVDQANFRVVVIDLKKKRIAASLPRGPHAIRAGFVAGWPPALRHAHRDVRIQADSRRRP